MSRCGTPGYVAPEVLNNEKNQNITDKVDIFSCGAMMYRFLTGSRIFPGGDAKAILKANKECNINYDLL